MKCFYKELNEKRKFFITQLNNKYAALEWAWFQQEITDEEYDKTILEVKELDKRIADLQG